jgi:hypothetical protein
MIPQRMLGNEISHSGVRNRVTACRKRLRENRVMKAVAAADSEELFSEDARISQRTTEGATEPVRPEVGMT